MELVFCNLFGRPLEPGNVLRRSFEPPLAQAGCPRIRFHDLRHTAATLPSQCLVLGPKPLVLSSQLGQLFLKRHALLHTITHRSHTTLNSYGAAASLRAKARRIALRAGRSTTYSVSTDSPTSASR